jgi:hypothetical protein
MNKMFAISCIANNIYTGDNRLEPSLSILPSSYGASANILTVETGKTSALLYDSYVEITTEKDYGDYNGDAANLYLSGFVNGNAKATSPACGAVAIGSVLTKSEMQTLKSEVETLYNVFHTQN